MRVERLVRQILVSAAVELIRSRFGREVEHAAEHLAELRREVAGLDGEFAYRLDRGGSHRAGPDCVVGRCDVLAFEINLEGTARRAVDVRRLWRSLIRHGNSVR